MLQARSFQVIVFFALLGLAAFWASPPLALLLGLVVGLWTGHPYPKSNSPIIKKLLQYSVIGLGFGMNLNQVLQAGQTGILLTICTIAITVGCGYLLGKCLNIPSKTAQLISVGTAICGGSAIAAIGPVLDADEQEMSVSLGTIFILNAIALLIFPAIGHAFHLTQNAFGLWAAIAIHDTSSVVGAAAKYGSQALTIATTVKLARALWIVPLVLLTAFVQARQHHDASQKPVAITVPYFILFFLLASVLQTYLPPIHAMAPWLVHVAKLGLTLTLFLIGAGLSVKSLKAVGIRPLILGILLWILIGIGSLWAIITFRPAV